MTIYYFARDRIPFFLTLIYLYRNQIRSKFKSTVLLQGLGYYLISITGFLLIVSCGLLVQGDSMAPLVGFRWSFPSPLQWGILTLVGTFILIEKGVQPFDAYYISFMSSLAGGWVFEILYGLPYWIKSGFATWNAFNFNIYKVFIVDFQVLSIPIILYLIHSRFKYVVSTKLKAVSIGALVFYLVGPSIAPFFHRMGTLGGNSMYAWVLRIPIGVAIYVMLSEVEK